MTIKTLEYIHTLLLEQELKTGNVYKESRKLQHEYEGSEAASKELIKSQTEAAEQFMRVHLAALEALEDFEMQEW